MHALKKMPNRNYIKGRRKEYKIMKELREQGFKIVARTAGSHSPIDVIAIKPHHVLLIQSKPEGYSKSKILEELSWLKGEFNVWFEVR